MNPSDPVNVTMERQHWVTICNMLAEQPYKFSAPLIHQIQIALSRSHSEETVTPNE